MQTGSSWLLADGPGGECGRGLNSGARRAEGSRRKSASRGLSPAQKWLERAIREPSRRHFAPGGTLSTGFCAGAQPSRRHFAPGGTLSSGFCAGGGLRGTLSTAFCAGRCRQMSNPQKVSKGHFAPDPVRQKFRRAQKRAPAKADALLAVLPDPRWGGLPGRASPRRSR
jgi:hypothetical protein